MKTKLTPSYFKVCGDPRRCIRCGVIYWQVQTRGAQAGEDWRRCPRCVEEILAPQESIIRELLLCASFVAAFVSWAAVL